MPSNNDQLDPEELYVSACYVDEGPTAKRWRPRARGRATRIRKRSSHITVIVSRLPEERLARLQARRRAENLAMRARRVEATRRARTEGAEAPRTVGSAATPKPFRPPRKSQTTEEASETAAGDGGDDVCRSRLSLSEVANEEAAERGRSAEAASAETEATRPRPRRRPAPSQQRPPQGRSRRLRRNMRWSQRRRRGRRC